MRLGLYTSSYGLIIRSAQQDDIEGQGTSNIILPCPNSMVILQILEGDITNFYYVLVGLKKGKNSIFVLIPSYVKWEQQKLSYQFLCMCNSKKLFLFLVSDGDGATTLCLTVSITCMVTMAPPPQAKTKLKLDED